MKVDFFKGVVERKPGDHVTGEWAHTHFGIMAALRDGGERTEDLEVIEPEQIVASEKITSVDLPGLDDESVTVIVRSVLAGDYLDKPGVKDKGDAVLFVLVNEAIHEMSALEEREEESD